MEKLTDILAMGGYAEYVWSAYLAAGIMMAGLTIVSLRALKRASSNLAQLQNSRNSNET
jgi:heme exporter protein D